VNDVILAVEGVPLRPGATLRDALLPFRPQEPVRLTIMHTGERRETLVTLGAR
jgi:S1-C subfamily serine protease